MKEQVQGMKNVLGMTDVVDKVTGGVVQFTREEFEAALPTHNGTSKPLWTSLGIIAREYTYTIPVTGTNKRVIVRSSVTVGDKAAPSGKNSIRLWVEYYYKNQWFALAKADSWTTRITGWEGRMVRKIRELWQLALDDSRSARQAPTPDDVIPPTIFSVGSPQWQQSFLPESEPINTIKYTREPNDEQRAAIEAPIDQAVRVLAPPGSGKCLAPGTPVLLYNGGTVPVEEVRVGMQLMGPDSKPRLVLRLGYGYDEMYCVTPKKGNSYVTNGAHILSLKTSGNLLSPRQVYPSYGGDGAITSISVDDYLRLPKYKREHLKGWRIGVDFPDKSVDLPPYFVGIWLGDGQKNKVGISTADSEILAYAKQIATTFGLKLKHIANYDYVITSENKIIKKGHRGFYNPITSLLRHYNLLNNKHIPEEYKINSRSNRLELLAGLLDTDGHYQTGCYEIIQKRKRLATDILFLARSLGFAAYMSEKIVDGTSYWRMGISGQGICSIPCLLPRKKAKPRKQKKDVLRTGITITPIGVGEYYGFQLDGDGLFLLGDFTVTHNTFVLAHRYAHLLANDVTPREILAVTFNKKMATELLDRITKVTPSVRGTQADRQVCTIHAACYRMLREEGKGKPNVASGYKIKRIIEDLALEYWRDVDKRPGWTEIYAWVNLAKSNCLATGEDLEFYIDRLGHDNGQILHKIKKQLTLKLNDEGLWTYPDMLYRADWMLQHDTDFREKLQRRFRWIMVDEGQDTSGQAMRILTTLAKPQNQFFMVGDMDQTLYRFTGATPEVNLLGGFEDKFPDALTIKLLTNYRSTVKIIEAAQTLIGHNYGDGNRYNIAYLKAMRPRQDAPEGSSISFNLYANPADEAAALTGSLTAELASREPGEIFVGARTRAQLGYLEGGLVRAKIPFINATGGSFWGLRHVSELVSYLKLAFDHSDKDAFARVYNVPSNLMTVPWRRAANYGEYCPHRYLGRAFLEACDGSFSQIEFAMNVRSSFRPGGKDLLYFVEDLEMEMDSGDDSPQHILHIIRQDCYNKYLKVSEGIADNNAGDTSKLDDLDAVLDIAGQFETIEDFLGYVKSAEAAAEASRDKSWDGHVVISTVHRLKGLERDVVYGVGLSEGVDRLSGLLPHTFSMVAPPRTGVLPMGGRGLIEDERCIAYVLVTRARDEVHLSGVRKYRDKKMTTSRFIAEMERKHG